MCTVDLSSTRTEKVRSPQRTGFHFSFEVRRRISQRTSDELTLGINQNIAFDQKSNYTNRRPRVGITIPESL